MFQDTLEPSLWDLFNCNLDEEISREIYYPEEEEDQEFYTLDDSSDDDIGLQSYKFRMFQNYTHKLEELKKKLKDTPLFQMNLRMCIQKKIN